MWETKQFGLPAFCIVAIFLSTWKFRLIASLPLSVSSRYVVDETGTRVKLACVNWAGHMEETLPEGLDKQPISAITDLIVSSGFNCVRLTWATYMFTRPENRDQTVLQTFTSHGLDAAINGISTNNPNLLQLSPVEAFGEVIRGIAEKNLLVILDNHVSKPGWCCGHTDGNGWWGDQFFDPAEWLTGLRGAANLSLGHSNVIGIGLRNEPRGPRQNVADWRKYMVAGAEAVHGVNPDLLVCIGGVSYSADLSFLSREPLKFGSSSLRQKLVYELHWYSWYSGLPYGTGNLNQVCASDMKRVMDAAGYLLTPGQEYTSPVLVSEFGLLQSGEDPTGNHFLDCFITFAASLDLDYALWALQGSYYRRNGQADFEETFGLLNKTWNGVRNAGFVQRLRGLQYPLPGLTTSGTRTYTALFHPATGLCVVPSCNYSLELSPCTGSSSMWSYDPQTLMVKVKQLGAVISTPGEGSTAILADGTECVDCQWSLVSDARLQLAVQVEEKRLCLDGTSGTVVTAEACACVTNSECINSSQTPGKQWFQFISGGLRELTSRQVDEEQDAYTEFSLPTQIYTS